MLPTPCKATDLATAFACYHRGLHHLIGPCPVTAAHMRYVLFTATWELECCGRALAPGSVLHLTLNAVRDPALAVALERPGVPEHSAVVWQVTPLDEADRADFVLYGAFHGPDEGPRVAVRVEQIWEIRGDLEPDPDQPYDAVRIRPGSRHRVLRDHVPARLGCGLHQGADWPSQATDAVAFSVSLTG